MSDWWARKLNDPAAPPRTAPPVPIPARPMNLPAPQPIQTNRCPECRSENYLTTRTPHRCFDCGYQDNGRDVRNSTQGLPSPGGKTTGARQAPTEGYQPQNIVGRI